QGGSNLGRLAIAAASQRLGLPDLEAPGQDDTAVTDRPRDYQMPADKALFLVVPDLAQPGHLPAAFGDADIVDQQRDGVAGAGPQLPQQQGPGLPIEQVGRVPGGVIEEIAACGAVAAAQQSSQVRQLGLAQVEGPGGDQGPKVAELGLGQQAAQGLEEGLQALGESVNNHGRPRRLNTGTTRTRISLSRPCRYAKGQSARQETLSLSN